MSDISLDFDYDRHYRTNDFALAVVLSLVYPVVAIDAADPDDVWFTVERGELTDAYMARYHERMLLVEPRELMDKMVELHDRMAEAERTIC